MKKIIAALLAMMLVLSGVCFAEEATATQGVVLPGWGAFAVLADSDVVYVDFFNPEDNADRYYLTFELWVELPPLEEELTEEEAAALEAEPTPEPTEAPEEEIAEGEEALEEDNGMEYEMLYCTELVMPGEHVQEITLTRPIPEGEYNAYVHIQPYRMDDDITPTMNNGNVVITLYAINPDNVEEEADE